MSNLALPSTLLDELRYGIESAAIDERQTLESTENHRHD